MWRIVPLLIVAALIGGACGSGGTDIPGDPTLYVARLDEVPSNGALYSPTHHLFVADSPAEGLVALVAADPYRGCRIGYIADDDARRLASHEATRFIDPCHGSEYDISGKHLAGPSPRSMDRLPIEVIADRVYLVADAELIETPRPRGD